MITLHSLHLEKYIVFDDLTWQLDQHPLTVIRGRNLDRRSRSGNAVGKSLLPSAIANLINGAPPLTIKKKAAQELVHNKARATLNLTNDTVNWQLQQFAKGKSVGYNIIKNLKPQNTKTMDTARQLIKQAMPLSEDHFYSQFYLSSFAPSVMLFGNAASRMNYFEQIFDLRIHDLLRKALLQELQHINGKFSQQQLLQQQRQNILPKTQQDLSTKIAKIKSRHQDLLINYQQANNELQNLIAYTTLAEQINNEGTLKILQHQQRRGQNKLRKLRQQYRKIQQQLGAAKNSAKIHRRRHKLLRQLAKLPQPMIINIDISLDKLDQRIEQIRQQLIRYERFEIYIEKYHAIIKARVNAPIHSLDKLQQQTTELAHNIKQRQSLRGGQPCPLCGTVVNNTRHKHTLQQWQRQLNKLQNKLTTAKQLAFCQKLNKKIGSEIINLDVGQTQQQLIKYRQQHKKLLQQQELIDRRRELTKRLRVLPKATKTQAVDQRHNKQLVRNIDKYEEQQNRLINDIRLLEKLADMQVGYTDLSSAKTALRKLQSNVAIIAPKLQIISDKMHQFTMQQSEYKIAQRQLQEINQQLDELDQAVADRDVVSALTKAYSAKGIRVLQINALTSAYVNALNTIAASLYPEPVKFHAEIGVNQFDLLIERSKQISDVRRLSGSESRTFLVTSALAFIGLMPSNLRCAQLILDELESGLAPPERRHFTHEFLPMLANSIPHVIVLTPQSSNEMPIPDAVEFMLERKNGITNWRK